MNLSSLKQMLSGCDFYIGESESSDKIFYIATEKIIRSRTQPRRYFDRDELERLAKSISQVGIIEPLIVRKDENGRIILICGERRLRAAELSGLYEVPCVFAEISEKEAAFLALIENIQRKELNCFEQAEGFRQLIESYGLTQQEAALRLGLSQSAVANKLRLLQLSPRHREMILRGGLTERHARAVLRADEFQRDEIIQLAVKSSFTAAETDKYIDELSKQNKIKKSYRKRAAVLSDVKLFFNTVEKALNVIRLAGVDAKAEKRQEGEFIEYVIKIPDKNAN